MEFTAHQISELLLGTIIGDPTITVCRLSKIEEGISGSLSFLANPVYTPFIYETKASIVIVNNDFVPEKPISSTLIKVENSYLAFAKLLEIYNTIKRNKSGIEEMSFIDPTATYGKEVYIGSFAYVGKNSKIGDRVKIYPNVFIDDNCEVGDDTVLFPGVRIYSDCIIGKGCTIHGGAIIGADGFGFKLNNGTNDKISQIGNVIIKDFVDIGANTTIDRATLGSTIIHKGVKLDNLIQIGHNVEIGENTVIAAQSGVAGSTKIGSNCMIGGQVGIVGHITIADGVKIAAQSGIGNSITKNDSVVQGSPAFNIGEFKRTYVVFRKLPELENKISEMQKMIDNLSEIITSRK